APPRMSAWQAPPCLLFFFSSRRRHTRWPRDWSSDVCSSDLHELETAKRERTATVNLVFRDGGLGSIRWKQMAKFGRMTGTGFDNPDFVRLAEAFGIRGFRVEHPSELSSVLSEALGEASPTVVDIPVDYSD